jgi:hypothetical protein
LDDDFKRAKKSVSDFKRELKSDIKATEEATKKKNKLVKSMASLGGLIKGALGLVAVRKFSQALRFMSRSASGVETEMIKLKFAMESAGRFSEETYGKLVKQSRTLERATGVTREEILRVQTVLQTFGKMSAENIQKATAAALDMSVIFKENVVQSAIRIGKASVGQLAAMRRVGVAVESAKFQAEGFAHVLNQLSVEFGSQSQARLRGFSGLINKIAIGFKQLAVATGDYINSNAILRQWMEGMSILLNSFTDSLTKNKKAAVDAALGLDVTTASTEELSEALKALGIQSRLSDTIDELTKQKELVDELIKSSDRWARTFAGAITAIRGGREAEEEFLKKSGQAGVVAIDRLKSILKLEEEVKAIREDPDQLTREELILQAQKAALDKSVAERIKTEEDAAIQILNIAWDNMRKEADIVKAGISRKSALNSKARKKRIAEDKKSSEIQKQILEEDVEFVRNIQEDNARISKEQADGDIAQIKRISDFKRKNREKDLQETIEHNRKQLSIMRQVLEEEQEANRDSLRKKLLDEQTSGVERSIIMDETAREIDRINKGIAAAETPEIALGLKKELIEVQKTIKNTELGDLLADELAAGFDLFKNKIKSPEFAQEKFISEIIKAQDIQTDLSTALITGYEDGIKEIKRRAAKELVEVNIQPNVLPFNWPSGQ